LLCGEAAISGNLFKISNHKYGGVQDSAIDREKLRRRIGKELLTRGRKENLSMRKRGD